MKETMFIAGYYVCPLVFATVPEHFGHWVDEATHSTIFSELRLLGTHLVRSETIWRLSCKQQNIIEWRNFNRRAISEVSKSAFSLRSRKI
jgi:hypothetical protein